MESITFKVEGIIIQLANGRICFWNGNPDKVADIDLPIDILCRALATSDMLIKPK